MTSSELVLPGKGKELTLSDIPINPAPLISEPFRPVVSGKVLKDVFNFSSRKINRLPTVLLLSGTTSIGGLFIGSIAFTVLEPAVAGMLGLVAVFISGGVALGLESNSTKRVLLSKKLPLYGQLIRKNRAAFVEWVKGRYGIELSPEVPDNAAYCDLTLVDGTQAPYIFETVYDEVGNEQGVVLSQISKAMKTLADVNEVPVQFKQLASRHSDLLEGEAELLLVALEQKQKRLAGFVLAEEECHKLDRVNRELVALFASVEALSRLGESTSLPECVDVLASMNEQLQSLIDSKVKELRSSVAVQSAFMKMDSSENTLSLTKDGVFDTDDIIGKVN